MLGSLVEFLKAIPDAASTPYGVVAFLAVLLAWSIISYRVARNKNLIRHIGQFPLNDRRVIVQAEMGAPVPPKLTPEQWIRSRIHRYYYYAFVALIICFSVILILTSAIRSAGPNSRLDATLGLHVPPIMATSPASTQKHQ
jgi:hypothetical protein